MVLTGKKVLVTGASMGIGRGVAERFVAEGADVWFLARDARALADVVEPLGARAHMLTAGPMARDTSSDPGGTISQSHPELCAIRDD